MIPNQQSGYTLDDSDSIPSRTGLLLCQHIQTRPAAHPTLLFNVSGVNWQKCEDDHSPYNSKGSECVQLYLLSLYRGHNISEW